MFPRAIGAAAIVAAAVVAAVGLAGPGRPIGSVGGPPTASPVVVPSPNHSFETSNWTLHYHLPSGWQLGGQTPTDFGVFGSTGEVVVGILEAAVHPDSMYVTYPELDSSVGTSPEEFVAWLAEHPRVDTTTPLAVSIGGRAATQVDVTLKPGQNYAQGQIPSRLGLAWFGGDTVAIGLTNGESQRYIVLEFAGDTVVIMISPADPPPNQAQQILESFVFEE